MKQSILSISIFLFFGLALSAQDRNPVIKLARKECNVPKSFRPSRVTVERERFMEGFMMLSSFEADTIALVEYISGDDIPFYHAFFEYDSRRKVICSADFDINVPIKMSMRKYRLFVAANIKDNANDAEVCNNARNILARYFDDKTRRQIEDGCYIPAFLRGDQSVYRILVFVRKNGKYSIALFKNLEQQD